MMGSWVIFAMGNCTRHIHSFLKILMPYNWFYTLMSLKCVTPLDHGQINIRLVCFFHVLCQVLNQYATLTYCEPISIIWNGLNCVELVYDNYILSYLTLVKMLLKIFNIFWYHIVFTHICKIAVMLYMYSS